jgi:hypothetical protein
MSTAPPVPAPDGESLYWRARVLAETNAALSCEDARTAAIHVELATRCLRMAQRDRPPTAISQAAEEA